MPKGSSIWSAFGPAGREFKGRPVFSRGSLRPVQKGFNSDVAWAGASYHVQTEDWGSSNPYLVSRVFQNGAVVKSINTAYAEILGNGPAIPATAIRLAMKIQHQQILDLLLSGKLI